MHNGFIDLQDVFMVFSKSILRLRITIWNWEQKNERQTECLYPTEISILHQKTTRKKNSTSNLSYITSLLLCTDTICQRKKTRSVLVCKLNCDIAEGNFKIQSYYYIYFLTHTFGKVIESLYLPCYGLDISHLIEYPTNKALGHICSLMKATSWKHTRM